MRSHRVAALAAAAVLAGSSFSLIGANTASAANVLRGTKWTVNITWSATVKAKDTWSFLASPKGEWSETLAPPQCTGNCLFDYSIKSRNVTVGYVPTPPDQSNYLFIGKLNATHTTMSGTVTCTEIASCAELGPAHWSAVLS